MPVTTRSKTALKDQARTQQFAKYMKQKQYKLKDIMKKPKDKSNPKEKSKTKEQSNFTKKSKPNNKDKTEHSNTLFKDTIQKYISEIETLSEARFVIERTFPSLKTSTKKYCVEKMTELFRDTLRLLTEMYWHITHNDWTNYTNNPYYFLADAVTAERHRREVQEHVAGVKGYINFDMRDANDVNLYDNFIQQILEAEKKMFSLYIQYTDNVSTRKRRHETRQYYFGMDTLEPINRKMDIVFADIWADTKKVSDPDYVEGEDDCDYEDIYDDEDQDEDQEEDQEEEFDATYETEDDCDCDDEDETEDEDAQDFYDEDLF